MATSPLAVSVRHRYAAPPELVFRAFTDPDVLPRWFSPAADIEMSVLAHDLRPGGRYRFRYREPDGTVSIVTGVFCEVVPPRRLVFTWTWEPPDVHAGLETLVTIEIVAEGSETLVVVQHERFPDPEVRDRHDNGWRSTLARMATN